MKYANVYVKKSDAEREKSISVALSAGMLRRCVAYANLSFAVNGVAVDGFWLCERPSTGMRKAVFHGAKDGLLQDVVYQVFTVLDVTDIMSGLNHIGSSSSPSSSHDVKPISSALRLSNAK